MTNNLGFLFHFPEISLFSDDVKVKQDYEDFKQFFTEEKVNVEYEIWEFKLDSKQYLLSIRDKEVSLHLEYSLNKMEGESSTREKALKYFIKKYGSSFVRYSGKIAVCSYSSFRRGVSKEIPLKKRYYSVADLFKKAKLEIAEPNESKMISIIAKLEPIKRSREFNFYNESVRDKVVYEYLFYSRTHRWLDENVIGLKSDESRGYQAMGILHFIGLKDKHKGIFKGLSIDEAINLLELQNSDFDLVIQSLQRFINKIEKSQKLKEVIINDIDSEQAEEESYHKDGAVKGYYGKRYERNPENRKKAIEIHGLSCVACGFNFEEVYGDRGKDFIEVHHVKPLSTVSGEVTIDPKEDLVPVCSNCHRMIHRRKDNVLTVEELRFLVNHRKR
ncbi:hypothetical protein IC7_00571 [Bacillus cereus BAG1O-1]|nr:hypothetical protein IC7_00571 [Bacillus cereus BAG1O-1]